MVPDWGVDTLIAAGPEYKQRCKLHRSALAMIASSKSPAVYLNHHMPKSEANMELIEYALATLPLHYDVIYWFDQAVPSVAKEKLG